MLYVKPVFKKTCFTVGGGGVKCQKPNETFQHFPSGENNVGVQ